MNQLRSIRNSFLVISFVVFCLCNLRVTVLASENDYLNITNKGEAIQGTGKVIYILKDGIKHQVTEWGYFLSLGYQDTDIHHYNDTIIESYSNGTPVSPPIPPVVKEIVRNPCPCLSSSSHDLSNEEKYNTQISQKYLICFVKNKESEGIFTTFSADQLDLNHLFLSDELVAKYMLGNSTTEPAANGCNVLIKLVTDESIDDEIERRCPGVCLPIPYMEVPLRSLSLPYNLSRSLTCSLRMSTLISHRNLQGNNNQNTSEANSIGLILRSISQRRMEECSEPGLWPMGSFSYHNITTSKHWSNTAYLRSNMSTFPKRKVYGLIIWVGSVDRLHLVQMQSNLLTLQNRTSNDSQKIFGWIATEEVYPCNITAPPCKHRYGYHWMMPSGQMAYKGNTGYIYIYYA